MELKSLNKIVSFVLFPILSYDINSVKFLTKIELFVNTVWSCISIISKFMTLQSICDALQNFKKVGVKLHVSEPSSPIVLVQESCALVTSHQNCKKSTVGREDICLVMDRLGILCDLEGVNIISKFANVEDVLMMSDDVEDEECVICLEEVREAFDVFDYNKDGLIDEMELQRVLSALCIQQQDSTLDECRRMIREFDDNGDGFIDFEEFVTLINSCF